MQRALLTIIFSIIASAVLAAEISPAPIEHEMEVKKARPAPAEEMSGFSTGSVVRSAFTNDIEDREPKDALKTATTSENTIYFFTELRDMSGQTAKHRWEHDGKVMAEVEFNVKGPRWRVWSSKTIQPGWEGDWKVSVINGAGDVISEKNLTLKPETPAANPAESTPKAPGAVSAQ